MSVTNRSTERILEIKYCRIVGEEAVVCFLKNVQRRGFPGYLGGADVSYQLGLYCELDVGPDLLGEVTLSS